MSGDISGKLTSIDLFAGCGGLTRGLEDAGFECIAFNELNHDAAASFSANFPDATPHVGHIESAMDNKALELLKNDPRINGSIDLVCGGPPCQGFSGIGHRRTHDVEKETIPTNHLFKEMARVIRVLSPKAFLFENVKGILSGKWTKDGENGEIFWDVWDEFASIEGYTLQPALLKGYGFGVPQNRPRVMILGIKDEYLVGKGIVSKIVLPDKEARKNLNWRATQSTIENPGGLFPRWKKNTAPDLIDVIGDLDYEGWAAEDPFYPNDESNLSDFQRDMRKGVKDKNKVKNHEFSNHKPDTVEKFQYMIKRQVRKMEDMPKKWRTKKFSQRVTPQRWKRGEKPWITVTSLADDYVHYAKPRSFSVREWARIQTFPDRHVFCGKRTTGGERRAGNPSEGIWDRDLPLYTQIGNAVPPRMGRAIGEKVSEMLRPKKPSPAHVPLGKEVSIVNQIVSTFGIRDYATVRFTPRALGKRSASGGDQDAPVNLRKFCKINGIADYGKLAHGAENGRVLNAKLVSVSDGLEDIEVNFSKAKGRGDPRFWPRKPFKDRCDGNEKFGGDLVLVTKLNDTLVIFIVHEFEIEQLEKVRQELNLPSWRRSLKSLINDMVDIYEKGWIESSVSKSNQKTADKDVGWVLERELGILPNSSKNPDYNGLIEVKSSAKLKKSLETLVCKVPGLTIPKSGNWKGGMSAKEICLEYGTKDSKGRRFALKNNISAKGHNSHGLRLNVNYSNELVEVFDNLDKRICVYDFERLKESLNSKHPTTLWAKADLSENGEFMYTHAEITMTPNFSSFLYAIERGEIIFDFRMHMETKHSTVRPHGPAFRIKSNKKNRMFLRYMCIDLDELSSLRAENEDAYHHRVQDMIYSQ